MFSGIIQERGTVAATGGGRLRIECDVVRNGLGLGDSVAVSGVCLTAAEVTDDGFAADVMPETLQRSTLGALRTGDAVNLERSLTLDSVLGGHLVTGHIDATGTVVDVREDGNARRVTVQVAETLTPLIAAQGSVAVDGISLTVVDAGARHFTVSLIPHTLEVTTAGAWRVGTSVNLEVDIVARYVQRLLEAGQARVPAEV